jgi:hypothetical protein
VALDERLPSTLELAFTNYRNGKYQIEVQRGTSSVAGFRPEASADDVSTLPPFDRQNDVVQQALEDGESEVPSVTVAERVYAPNMFLEAIGPPHVSSGGGPFGTFVRGGASLLFSDQLGERKLAVFGQAGNRLHELAIRVQFLNRERRWNWGGLAEVQPSLRRLPRVRSDSDADDPAITRETHYFEGTQFRVAGLLVYPLDQAQRFEFEAGAGHTAYRRSVSSVVRSMTDGRLLSRTTSEAFGGAPATVGEASAAFVQDTAVFGPTSPILGARSRFKVSSTFGELFRHSDFDRLPALFDAGATLHGGASRDSPRAIRTGCDDPRLLPTFLGSRQFVCGYGLR